MKTAVICVTVWIAINTLYCTGDPIAESTTTATTETIEYDVKGTTHWIDIFRGRDGRDGLQGPQGETGEQGEKGEHGIQGEKGERGKKGERGDKGEQGVPGPAGEKGVRGQSGGGSVYTRWGRTVCPGTNGTELVYQGLAAGSYSSHSGGGANYLCITEEPTYLSSTVPSRRSYLYGSDYKEAVFQTDQNNVPCAVCYTSQRSSKLMIPGKRSCPSSWTEEYEGYLMAENYNHARNAVYECVDKDGEAVSRKGADGALFYHVGVQCGYGLSCPPFVSGRPVTCVVCTK